MVTEILYFGTYVLVIGMGLLFFILSWMFKDVTKAVISMVIALVAFSFLTVASFQFGVGSTIYNNYYVGYIFFFFVVLCLISLLMTSVDLMTGKKTRKRRY